ncbi:methyl-accepting chemotaxis protein [Kiloniella laminariae]|uniref:Methyl-accepting chemotaxis protein n=1 Tax=Kiloniella laminariae TaxID=454162 RepID=A0ABT4LMX8_9PROT|nr:methyl-accepting chemotaxis protein [Kiloniella laminariae]MCZ4282488.1 methyl-accepting chemotaxis protein [Kiloniella laminariae]
MPETTSGSHVVENPANENPDLHEGKHTSPDEGQRGLSVKVKMLLAVGSIVATTLLAGLVGWISFQGVNQSLDQISSRSMPQMTTALKLSDIGTKIATAAPALISAPDRDEKNKVYVSLQEREKELESLTQELKAGDFDASLSEGLGRVAGDISSNLSELNNSVSRQLELESQGSAKMAELLSLKYAFDTAVIPYQEQAKKTAEDSIDQAFGSSDVTNQLIEILISVTRNQVSSGLRVDINFIFAQLAEAISAKDPAVVDGAEEEVRKAVARSENNLSLISDDISAEAVKIRELGKKLFSLLLTEETVFSYRRAMLIEQQTIQVLSMRNTELSLELTALINQVVSGAAEGAVASVSVSEDAIAEGKFWLSAISVLSVILAVFIVFFYVGRMIIERLVVLSSAMSDIANGDLTVEVSAGQNDEIGAMARALEVFKNNALNVERLRREREEAKTVAEAKRKADMNALADQFNSRVKAIVSTVQSSVSDLSTTAQGMNDIAGRAQQKSSQASQASSDVSINVDSVAAASEELSSSIEEISRQTALAATASREVSSDARETNQAVDSLSEAAEKIGAVVDLISEIADQTNLLALNATIEAARAGDAGKGFAVVASEVKNLATQTGSATDDISTQISTIRSTVQQAAEAIKKVTLAVGNVDEITSSIAAAVTEQSSATGEMSRNVRLAADGTTRVSQNIQEVMQASEETGDASETVLSASRKLAVELETLSREVDVFMQEIRN